MEIEEVRSPYEIVTHRSGQNSSAAPATDATQGSTNQCRFSQTIPVPPAAAKTVTVDLIGVWYHKYFVTADIAQGIRLIGSIEIAHT